MFSKLHYSVTMITVQKQDILLYALVQKHLIKVHVCHSSNLLYQGFAQRYFLGIYLHSKAKLRRKMKLESVCIFYNAPGR